MSKYTKDDVVVFHYQRKENSEGTAKIEAVDEVDPTCIQYTVRIIQHPRFEKGVIRLNENEIVEKK